MKLRYIAFSILLAALLALPVAVSSAQIDNTVRRGNWGNLGSLAPRDRTRRDMPLPPPPPNTNVGQQCFQLWQGPMSHTRFFRAEDFSDVKILNDFDSTPWSGTSENDLPSRLAKVTAYNSIVDCIFLVDGPSLAEALAVQEIFRDSSTMFMMAQEFNSSVQDCWQFGPHNQIVCRVSIEQVQYDN